MEEKMEVPDNVLQDFHSIDNSRHKLEIAADVIFVFLLFIKQLLGNIYEVQSIWKKFIHSNFFTETDISKKPNKNYITLTLKT